MKGPLLAFVAAALLAQNQTFRTAVDLVAIEVAVVDKTGQPVDGLTPADFEVFIGNRSRRVVRAERLAYGATSAVSPAAPDGTTPSTDVTRPRRMYVIAVDEHSLQAASARAAITAAERFIDKYMLGVEPADEDRDGRSHPIRVKVKRRGVELRSRAAVTIPRR